MGQEDSGTLSLRDHRGHATLPIAISNSILAISSGALVVTADLGKGPARAGDAVPRQRGGVHAAAKTSRFRRKSASAASDSASPAPSAPPAPQASAAAQASAATRNLPPLRQFLPPLHLWKLPHI